MSELAGPEARKSAFLLRRTSLTASATDEVGTSTTTLKASVSTHCRPMLEPTSGLSWWSADTMVTSICFAFQSKSSTDMLAAITQPSPSRPATRHAEPATHTTLPGCLVKAGGATPHRDK